MTGPSTLQVHRKNSCESLVLGKDLARACMNIFREYTSRFTLQHRCLQSLELFLGDMGALKFLFKKCPPQKAL